MKSPLDFEEVRRVANGMLSPNIYRRVYELARAAPTADVVEVGAAHGAATIAIGAAMKEKHAAHKLYSFEKILGGSREKFGGIDANLAILRANLEYFGVSNEVEILIGDVAQLHFQAGGECALGFLMLDADGAIDRDFGLFYNRLLPGSPIVIDDCEEWVKIKRIGRRRIGVDLKHLLTFHLVELFVELGLLIELERVEGTFFGKKPESATDPVEFRHIATVEAYRKLVFTSGQVPSRAMTLARRVLAPHPRLRGWLKRHVVPGAESPAPR
jgi:predicted O-methyltransferase YrrM